MKQDDINNMESVQVVLGFIQRDVKNLSDRIQEDVAKLSDKFDKLERRIEGGYVSSKEFQTFKDDDYTPLKARVGETESTVNQLALKMAVKVSVIATTLSVAFSLLRERLL